MTKPERSASISTLGRLLSGSLPESDVNWQAVLALARRDGVSSYLYWQLTRGTQEARWPNDLQRMLDTVRRDLREDFIAACKWGMRAEWELSQVLQILAEGGVQPLVLKGAATAAHYPSSLLRSYGDVDLLVPRVQVERAEELLKRKGYHSSRFSNRDWSAQYHRHLPPLVTADSLLPVELHWRLNTAFERAPFEAEDMLARATVWQVGGQSALRLDEIDAVLHLCFHDIIQDSLGAGFRTLCDAAQIIAGWDQNRWATLVTRAETCGLRRALYLLLALMERILDWTIPAGVMAGLQPSSLELLPEELESFLEFERGPRFAALAGVGALWRKAPLKMILIEWLRLLFPPPDHMAWRYDLPAGSPVVWLAYLWRPVDVLWRRGRQVVGLLPDYHGAGTVRAREARLQKWLAQEAPPAGIRAGHPS